MKSKGPVQNKTNWWIDLLAATAARLLEPELRR
jgi:hypothetical protein